MESNMDCQAKANISFGQELVNRMENIVIDLKELHGRLYKIKQDLMGPEPPIEQKEPSSGDRPQSPGKLNQLDTLIGSTRALVDMCNDKARDIVKLTS